MKYVYAVEIDIVDPRGLTNEALRLHIQDAVRSWGGSFEVNSPLFPSNFAKVSANPSRGLKR